MKNLYLFLLIISPFFNYCQGFQGHYVDWRNRRVQAITDYYGQDWFAGKKILELGCGHADIGQQYYLLGAHVTVSDARQEHLDVVADKYPHLHRILADSDDEWVFEDHYDMIIHMGLLYHLRNPEYSIFLTSQHCDTLVLETECSDSEDPSYSIETTEFGSDQAFNKVGSRPSPAFVERCLSSCGFACTRINDDRCNSTFHTYDWSIQNTGAWKHGQRRMWFCQKKL